MQGFDRLVAELRAVYTRHSLKHRGPHNLRFERDQVQPIFACVQDPLAIAPPGRQGVPQLPAVLARLSEHLKPDGDVGSQVPHAAVALVRPGGAQRGYQGVTGRIDFGGSVLRRVPVNKPVAIVTFRNGRPDPRATLVCGGRTGSPSWCPVDQVHPG